MDSYANYRQDIGRPHPQQPPPPPRYPQTSPFDDQAYPYQHPSYSESSWNDPPSRATDDPDPFADQNAVPLSNYRPKHGGSRTSTAPILEDYNDPFVRDAKPGKAKRMSRGPPLPQQGWFKGRITWVVFTCTLIQIIVFIAEIARNAVLTKSPIEIHPQFNPMIGPSPYVLINMGARYVPCMHNMPGIQNASTNIYWPCPNATATTGASVSCSLSELCGFNGVPNPHPGGSITDTPFPNQWFRFIIPIFLHAGFVHIGFNLLLQMTLGRDMELAIGSIRFFFVYFSSGIFGFVLGGNFAADGIASTGCSGSLFGILALSLLDLLYTWRTRRSPVKDLLFLLIDVVIAFILGLLPGLDNFSHIGGFLMGLVLGVCILRSPPALSRRLGDDDDTEHRDALPMRPNNGSNTYTPRPATTTPGITGTNANGVLYPSMQPLVGSSLLSFLRSPISFFSNRRPLWWIWWLVRVFALLGALVGFIVLLKNFYVWRTTCSWCKYLSCLPVNNWCDVGNLQFTSTSSGGGSSKRVIRELEGVLFGRS